MLLATLGTFELIIVPAICLAVFLALLALVYRAGFNSGLAKGRLEALNQHNS